MQYICDCGRVFTDPDGPIMCADSGHGQGRRSTQKQQILDRLYQLKNEAMRLYEANGKAAYESGQYNGIKWAIEEVEKMKI